MKQRLIGIGNAILEFLKKEEGCENAVFQKYEDNECITFAWNEMDFYLDLNRRGGGIRMGEVAKHGQLRDSEASESMQGIPMIDGFGPIGRIPSECSIGAYRVLKGEGENGRNKYEKIIYLSNPSEVHLLTPECVQKLDEILIRDFVRFFTRHFMVWKHEGFDLKILTHPRYC